MLVEAKLTFLIAETELEWIFLCTELCLVFESFIWLLLFCKFFFSRTFLSFIFVLNVVLSLSGVWALFLLIPLVFFFSSSKLFQNSSAYFAMPCISGSFSSISVFLLLSFSFADSIFLSLDAVLFRLALSIPSSFFLFASWRLL